MEKPLVSVLIISYNQFHLIFNCIDSILMQDYPNLELIISDDSSYDFDPEKVIEYIEENKKENLARYVVHRNEKNLGIVKNNNSAARLAQGEYLKSIAADDMLYNEKAISSVMPYFLNGSNILFTRGQFCDKDGNKKDDLFPQNDDFAILNASSADNNKLLYHLTTVPWCMIFAPGVFWRTSFFEEKGGYDEANYVHTEDWPMWVRLAMEGERFDFVDIITVWYREGGISSIEMIEGLPQSVRQAHAQESIDMLKNRAFPVVSKRIGRGAALRCWYSYKCIELRSLISFEWHLLSWRKKLLIKLQFMPFSIYLKLMSSVKWKFRFRMRFEFLLSALLFAMLALPQPQYEGFAPLTSALLACALAVVVIKIILNIGIFSLRARAVVLSVLQRIKS